MTEQLQGEEIFTSITLVCRDTIVFNKESVKDCPGTGNLITSLNDYLLPLPTYLNGK